MADDEEARPMPLPPLQRVAEAVAVKPIYRIIEKLNYLR